MISMQNKLKVSEGSQRW